MCDLPDHAVVKSDFLVSRPDLCWEVAPFQSKYWTSFLGMEPLLQVIVLSSFALLKGGAGLQHESQAPSCSHCSAQSQIPFAVLPPDSVCTCCPNVHTAEYSNQHTASQAHCLSFQSLCFPPVRALPPPLLQRCIVSQPDSSCSSHTSQLWWSAAFSSDTAVLHNVGNMLLPPHPLTVFGKAKQIWKHSGLSHFWFSLFKFHFHSPKGPFDLSLQKILN